jgi:hypothetical protein
VRRFTQSESMAFQHQINIKALKHSCGGLTAALRRDRPDWNYTQSAKRKKTI